MRSINICEEHDTGVYKVVFQTELYQLPAPIFEVTERHARAVLFGHKKFANMDKEDRVRACYLHCRLRYVSREHMHNTTFRDRFGIDVKNSAMASRVIKDTVGAGLIRPYDAEAGTKAMRYIPHWT